MTKGTDVDYDGVLAKSYDAGRGISVDAEATWREAVASYIPATGLVVDVGAGTGRFAERLWQSFGTSVLAVEPAQGMRDQASISTSDVPIHWMAGTAESLPLQDAKADVLWAAFTTHYFDLDGVAAESARVLEPSGVVLIWHALSKYSTILSGFGGFPKPV